MIKAITGFRFRATNTPSDVHVVFLLSQFELAKFTSRSADPLSPTSATSRARVRFKVGETGGEKVDPLKITERAATGMRNSATKAYLRRL